MGNVFGYTRVSTVKQGEKGVSLQEQKDSIIRYAHQHHLNIGRWFEERETAAKQGRPAFTLMLKLLRLRVADGVIIHKIDRSARNLQDWADVGKLSDAGVAIHFANESVDLATVSGRLSADIQAVVAAHYSRNLREETKKGFYGRLKQGFYPLRAPIGYRDEGAAKAKLLDPAMAPFVKECFERYSTGQWSLPELVQRMHERGLRNRRGGPVTMNGISTILTNPFYVGIMRIRRTGQEFSGNHEPLVSRDLFERVQALLHGKAVDRVVQHSFLFSRLVRCGSCRYSLIGERAKGHTYYRCHNRPFKSPPVCPTTSIREEKIEEPLLAHIDTLTLSEAEITLMREWIANRRQHSEAERQVQIRSLSLQLDSLRDRMRRLTDFLLDGSVEKAVFEEKQKALAWDDAQLRQRLASLQTGHDTALEEIERTVELAKNASLLYKQANPDKKRELLRCLLSNLTVSGKNVDVELAIPFRVIANREEASHGSPYRGTCRTLGNILDNLHDHFSKADPVEPRS
jgi:DNA invertase Pin-like site-specific DNA recombinase